MGSYPTSCGVISHFMWGLIPLHVGSNPTSCEVLSHFIWGLIPLHRSYPTSCGVLSHFMWGLIPPHVGSMCWTSRLHTARSCVCSRRVPFSVTSSLILSVHRPFDLPLFLVPCTSKAVTLVPTQSSSVQQSCEYERKLN